MVAFVAAAGCTSATFGDGDARPTAARGRIAGAPVASPAGALLALGEGEWAEETWDEEPGTPSADAPPPPRPPKPAAGASTFGLYIGGGTSMPSGGDLGSAAESVPALADVWRPGTSFEVVADFGPDKALRAYAQFGTSSFKGQTYTEPDDPNAQWYASNTTMTALVGGLKMGRSAYVKVGAGLLMMPYVAHVDAVDGFEVGIYEQTTGFTLALGGGYELKLGRLRAYVDLNYTTGVEPGGAENAVVLWPEFSPERVGILDVKTGVAVSF